MYRNLAPLLGEFEVCGGAGKNLIAVHGLHSKHSIVWYVELLSCIIHPHALLCSCLLKIKGDLVSG
jgi:hypothetical protein